MIASEHMQPTQGTEILSSILKWQDRPTNYGRISRVFHWLTATLLILQFTVLLTWRMTGENSATLWLVGVAPHGSLGVLILAITLARIAWAWGNRKQRPPYQSGLNGRIVSVLHITFYALLLWLPAIAILRQYGRGNALQFYGFELITKSERHISWMIAPADYMHGFLSWLLLILILGHISMALLHWLWFKDRNHTRMLGRPYKPDW